MVAVAYILRFASMFQSHICTLLNITQYLVLSHPFNYVLSILIVHSWMSGWKTSLTKIITSKILVRGCSKYIYKKNSLTRILLLSQNYGLVAFSNTALFLLALAFYRHLPTSGRQNMVKKGPQPLFTQKAFVPLCITRFSPFMAYPNISLRFRVGG